MRKRAYLDGDGSTGAALLRLLADATRLRILSLLLRTPDLCVCEMVAILRLPQYRISRHLGQLRRSRLLRAERRGPFVFYGIAADARREPVLAALLRAVPQLAGRDVAAGDLRQMRRLVRLEGAQRAVACSATDTVRARPILRMLTARPTVG